MDDGAFRVFLEDNHVFRDGHSPSFHVALGKYVPEFMVPNSSHLYGKRRRLLQSRAICSPQKYVHVSHTYPKIPNTNAPNQHHGPHDSEYRLDSHVGLGSLVWTWGLSCGLGPPLGLGPLPVGLGPPHVGLGPFLWLGAASCRLPDYLETDLGFHTQPPTLCLVFFTSGSSPSHLEQLDKDPGMFAFGAEFPWTYLLCSSVKDSG